MKLRHLFRDYRPGDVCTGLIMQHRLSTRSLLERGVIAVSGDTYTFQGFKKEDKR